MTPPDSGQLSPSTATCGACHRMIHWVQLASGDRVATEPEIINVVVTRGRLHPGALRDTMPRQARRLHAERCEDYQNQARRAETTAELKRYNARQAKRGRGGVGL